MMLEQAVAEALGLETELSALSEKTSPPRPDSVTAPAVGARGGRRTTPEPLPTDLTRRQREVVALLARGYTNRQIAAALVITEGSAHLHVVRLLNKRGFHTRAQVAAWAVAYRLDSGPAREATD